MVVAQLALVLMVVAQEPQLALEALVSEVELCVQGKRLPRPLHCGSVEWSHGDGCNGAIFGLHSSDLGHIAFVI